MFNRPAASTALAVTLFAISGASAGPVTDIVTLGVSLHYSERVDEQGNLAFHRLRGQSAFFTTRTGSLTTGGMLDGVTTFDSKNGVHEITFDEVFPEASLTDYLNFGYFGLVETVGYDLEGKEVVLDTSFVIAVQWGVAIQEWLTVSNLLGVPDEASLVDALGNSFDSDLFFTALGSASGNPDLMGMIRLGSHDGNQYQHVRDGEPLYLFAFNAGEDGIYGQEIGFIDTAILRIPTPGVLALGAFAGLSASRRRRG